MLNNHFLLYVILLVNIVFSVESLAIVTKTIGEVQYTKHNNKIIDSDLKLGLELFNDDLIKTKSDGFAKFTYLDDGTTIKMHKNSEVYVRGDIQEYLINKRISISSGTYNFDVNKQKDGVFTIITPTSVASVKGTKFILVSGLEGTDEFYGFEGLVEVLNKESNTTLRLSRNIKITSSPDGQINSEIMTQSDYNVTNQINQYEQEVDSQNIIPEEEGNNENEVDEDTDNSSSLDTDEIINELIIKIRNAQGEEKELIIKYNE